MAIQNTGQIELNSKKLYEALVNLFAPSNRAQQKPGVVCEIGTYKGTGSTRTIAKAILRANDHKLTGCIPLYTIEASWKNYREAKLNLEPFTFVKCFHGLSFDRKEMTKFIQNDELLLEHHKYPHVIIDSPDPIPFYISEIEGTLFDGKNGKRGRNHIMKELLLEIWDQKPLFVMDGAGGTGYYEFQQVVKTMRQKVFWMLMDDIVHVKNLRSYEYAKRAGWMLLAEEPKRWALWRKPANRANLRYWKTKW